MIWCRARLRSDDGAASVEFALVAPLLLLIAVAVLQLTLALHVRSVMVQAASEGARLMALAGADSAAQVGAGTQRTEQILAASIAGTAVRTTTARVDRSGPVPVAAIDVTADLPLIGLLGPTPMTVTGRAVLESTDELGAGFRSAVVG